MFKFKGKQEQSGLNSRYLPFGLARFFSWFFLLLVLASSVFLSLFIARATTATLLDSQEDYALLLAENLNKQIFNRFTLPVTVASGRVKLGDPEQYRLLDEVVHSLLHGLRVETIRIYNNEYAVTYSTNRDEVRRTDLYTQGVPEIFQGKHHHFDVLSTMSYFQAMLRPRLAEGSFQLRTIYPLKINQELYPNLSEEDASTVLGALEIIQDVSNHYQISIHNQWLIMGGFLVSSLVLFTLLHVVARKAEKVIAERMERNLQLEAELHQSEKLASMGRMVASIAHEIRNPLGIIRSSSEFLLRREKAVQDSSRPILEAIYDESCRLGSTVNDFLDYARPRQPRRDAVNMADVAHKAFNFLAGEFQRQNVELVDEIPPFLPVSGDEDLLYRAVYNVLINALQAIGGEGRVIVQGQVRDDGKTVLEVMDSGPGFAENCLKALDPFYTTKDNGTGLGLPIVQSIITSHGGKLELENGKDGGALIRFVLPSGSVLPDEEMERGDKS